MQILKDSKIGCQEEDQVSGISDKRKKKICQPENILFSFCFNSQPLQFQRPNYK